MPTLADLQQALDRLEAEAPDAAATRRAVLDRVGSGSSRPAWRHRTGPLLVAAVAVVVALATAVVLGIRGDVAQPAGPPPATDLTWTFDLPKPPAGITFRRLWINASQQTGLLRPTDRDASVTVTVHSPGSIDLATELQSPQTVTVAGQPGYFGAPPGRPTDSLYWPTPAGGWAQLDGFGLSRTVGPDVYPEPAEVLAEQLAIAPLVRFGRFGPPTLPFRLGWLPSGVSVQSTSSGVQGRGVDATFGSASFSDGGPVTVGVGTIVVARVDGSGGSFAEEIEEVVGPDRTALTVAGRSAVVGPALDEAREPSAAGAQPLLDARVLAVDVGDGSALLVTVGNPSADRYPLEVLSRIAEEADVSASMADPDTWIPAPEAVGG